MFPYRDDNPTFLTPVVTVGLVAANLLVWFLVQGAGHQAAIAGSICELGLIPAELLGQVPAGTRIPLGGGASCVLGSSAVWYTPVSSMFLHGGWLHVIGNMWFLWLFGNNVEDAMGHLRFLVFYLLTGLIGAGGQVMVHPDSTIPMVGASGAISGIMGAYILLYPRVRVHVLFFLGFFVFTRALPAWLMLGFWFLLQVLGGLPSLGGIRGDGGGVAFWAHAGGFAAGALLVNIFKNPALLARRTRVLPVRGWR